MDMKDLIQVARAVKVTVALVAHIFRNHVFIVCSAIDRPVATLPVITSFTHDPAALFVAMTEQVIPGCAVKVAFGALVMFAGVARVSVERVPGSEGALTAVAISRFHQ
jgi:hypothetical protein